MAVSGRFALAVSFALVLTNLATGQVGPLPAEQVPGRFLGTLSVTASPVEVLDANPKVTGKVYGALTAGDIANIDNYAAGRVGAVADGASLLLLRLRVPSGGRVACAMPGGAGDGSCQVLALGPQPAVGGSEIAAIAYTPPDQFGRGRGDVPAKYKDAVETRDVVVRLTVQVPGGQAHTTETRLLLARPPLVLVHGTFDSLALFRDAPGGMSFVQAVEAAGFKAFTVDYSGGGDFLGTTNTNQASFATNRDVVWSNAGGIRQALEFFRVELNLAATRADVVGHSLGGLLPRIYASEDYAVAARPYLRDDNFRKGDINRLVTMCSPHFGSALPQLLEVFKTADIDSAGPLGVALARLTVGLKQYWDGLDLEGAVRDQRPGSEALRRVGATPIPAFAIGCIAGAGDAGDPVFDPNDYYSGMIADLSWLFYIAPGLLQQYLASVDMRAEADQLPAMLDAFHHSFVARLAAANAGWLALPADAPDPRAHQQRELQEVFRALLFRYEANDFTVGLASQHGGLDAASVIDVANVLHSTAPQDWRVQRRVIEILKGESADPSKRFAAGGFPRAGQDVPPGTPSDELIAQLATLAGAPSPSTAQPADPRAAVMQLADAVQSDAYLRDEEAIRWSGMVYAHAVKFLQVAQAQGMVVMFRPINPDATPLIAADAATKPMNIKAKSANWGPQRGLLPVDQAFSKKPESDAGTIAAYNCDAYDNLIKQNAAAKPLTVTVEGMEFEVRRTIRSSGEWQHYGCAPDAEGRYVPTPAFADQLAQQIAIGERQPLVLCRVGSDGKADYRAASDAPAPQPMPGAGDTTLPLLVFAGEGGKYMTADYDMLAIGSKTNACEPSPHPDYGSICDWQIPLIVGLNRAAAEGACPYGGGGLVHHGPESQYAASRYIDYPVLAFIPAWNDRPARVVAVRQGPEGYRDMHLKRLFTQLRLEGWQIDPNPKAVGWQWGEFDSAMGYGLRDFAPPPDDAPEELIAAEGGALVIPCDPRVPLPGAPR